MPLFISIFPLPSQKNTYRRFEIQTNSETTPVMLSILIAMQTASSNDLPFDFYSENIKRLVDQMCMRSQRMYVMLEHGLHVCLC